MGKFDLLPTNENILKSLQEDIVDRNGDLKSCLDLLNSLDSGTSIALDGKWGTGKTFFVKQLVYLIDLLNDLDELDDGYKNLLSEFIDEDKKYKKQLVAYYDAWENDDSDNPVLSLVYSIVQETEKNINKQKEEVIKKISDCVLSLLEVVLNRPFIQATNNILDNKKDDVLLEITKRESVKLKINDYLSSLLKDEYERLIIIVDELDRCKPSYAVELLETIKHYFSNSNITFIFSVNKKQLVHTIKKFYGNDFDANGYFDRFFDLPLSLSEVNMDSFCSSIIKISENDLYDNICKNVIKFFDFNMRTVGHFFESAKRLEYKKVQNQIPIDVTTEKCANYIVPLMIGLKINDVEEAEKFISGKSNKILIDFKSFLDKQKINNPIMENIYSKESYDALFVEDYIEQSYKELGSLIFTKKVKEKILKLYNQINV